MTLAQLARHLGRVATATPAAEARGLEAAGRLVVQEARDEVGTYQPGWQPLADATRADRVRRGFTPDDPLRRTGGLADSISHRVTGRAALIGSTSPIMPHHEFGTRTIPARSWPGRPCGSSRRPATPSRATPSPP